MNDWKYRDVTEKIIGAAMKVHAALGSGFQEYLYQRALEIELGDTALRFQREKEMPVYYKGIQIGERRVDFLIEEKVMVELKAITALENVHLAQAKNYLEAYHVEVGLLINFGSLSLQVKRLFNQKFTSNSFKNLSP